MNKDSKMLAEAYDEVVLKDKQPLIRIKTKDSKFWIANGGYSISEDESDATIFPTIRAAKAYIKGTNVFGDLQIDLKEAKEQNKKFSKKSLDLSNKNI